MLWSSCGTSQGSSGRFLHSCMYFSMSFIRYTLRLTVWSCIEEHFNKYFRSWTCLVRVYGMFGILQGNRKHSSPFTTLFFSVFKILHMILVHDMWQDVSKHGSVHCSWVLIYSWETSHERVSENIFLLTSWLIVPFVLWKINSIIIVTICFHWADFHAMFHPYIKLDLSMEMWSPKTFYSANPERQMRKNSTLLILV